MDYTYGVDTWQVGVPGGDCAIHLLIQSPPTQVGRDVPPGPNPDGKYGTIIKAVLVDGGHDCMPGRHGDDAAKAIKQVLEILPDRYIIPSDQFYENTAADGTQKEYLMFNCWVVTHWDRDHWCGAMMYFQQTIDAGHRPFVKDAVICCPIFDTKGKMGAKTAPVTYFQGKTGMVKLSRDGNGADIITGRNNKCPISRIVEGDELMGYDFFMGQKQFDLTLTIKDCLQQDRAPRQPYFLCIGHSGKVWTQADVQRPKDATADNFMSIIAIIAWPNRDPYISYICGGDAYYTIEDSMTLALGDMGAVLLKASHHGSRTSTSVKFLKACKPRAVVVSAGREHGHPSWPLLSLLSEYKLRIHQILVDPSSNQPVWVGNCLYPGELTNPWVYALRYPYYLWDWSSSPLSNKTFNLDYYLDNPQEHEELLGRFEGLGISGRLFSEEEGKQIWDNWLTAHGFSLEECYMVFLKNDQNRQELIDRGSCCPFRTVANILRLFFWPVLNDRQKVLPAGNIAAKKAMVNAAQALIHDLWKDLRNTAMNMCRIRQLTALWIRSRGTIEDDGIVSQEPNRIWDDLTMPDPEFTITRTLLQKNNPAVAQDPKIVFGKRSLDDVYWSLGEDDFELDGLKKLNPNTSMHLELLEEGYSEDMLKECYDELLNPMAMEEEIDEPHNTGLASANRFDSIESVSSQRAGLMNLHTKRIVAEFPESKSTGDDSSAQLSNTGTGASAPGRDQDTESDAPVQIKGIFCRLLSEERGTDRAVSLKDSKGESLMYYTIRPELTFTKPVTITEPNQANVRAELDPINDCLGGLLYIYLSTPDSSPNQQRTDSPDAPVEPRPTVKVQCKLSLNFTTNEADSGHSRGLAADISQVDIKIDFSPSSTTLYFSTAIEALRAQFQDSTEESQSNLVTENGMAIRPCSLLMAFKPNISNSDALTMSEVLALINVHVSSWINDAMKEIKVKPEPGATRSAIWFLPYRSQSLVLKLSLVMDKSDGGGGGGLTKLVNNCISAIHLEDIKVMAKVTCSLSLGQDSICRTSELAFTTIFNLTDFIRLRATIRITSSIVSLTLSRDTTTSSEANLFGEILEWLDAKDSPDSLLPKDVMRQLRERLEFRQQQDAGTSSDYRGLYWRYLTLTFQQNHLIAARVMFEYNTRIGAPADAKTLSSFALTFDWQLGSWKLQGEFVPGDSLISRADVTPRVRLSPMYDPLKTEAQKPLPPMLSSELDLLRLDPRGNEQISEDAVPSWLPRKLKQAVLSISSNSIQVKAELWSSAASQPLPSKDSVPTLDFSRYILELDASYGYKEPAKGLSFLLSGTIFLPIATSVPTGDEQQNLRDMPQLRAEIAYNQPDSPKSWKFSASAQGMPMIALGPLFGDEKGVVMEMLGHIKLVDVGIAYNFSGESASGLSLNAKVNIGLLQLQLSYDRGTVRRAVPPSDPKDPSPPDLAGKETGWALLMSLKAAPDATADKLTVMLRDLIGDLLGPDCAEALPSFIGDTQLNFKESHLEVKLNSRKIAVVGGEAPSTSSLVLSCEVVLDNIMLHFCSLGSMSEASPPEPVAQPDDKPSSPDKPSPGTVSTTKRLIRITTLLPFLSLPEMPAIGPIQLPFEGLSFIWASRDFTTTEVAMINERAFTSSKIQVLLSDTGKGGDGSAAAPECGISLKAGCHLMLINESKVPLVGCHFGGGTPSTSGPKDQLGKKPEVPAASSGSPDVKPTTNASSRNTKAISSPSRMRPMKKKIGAISISNIGLAYNAGKLSVQVDAQATIGPLQCALDGFSIDLDLQNVTGFDVSQLEKIDVDVSLLGLGIAYNGPSVAIAGLLKRIGEEGREGFSGGVIASVTPYSLIAYGSCTEVQKSDGGSFKSMFVYVSFQGPILKTPYVELLGIRGGFGYNSQLRLPDITQMDNFPFIKRTDTPDGPMGVLKSLSSSQDNQQAWITEQEGSLWFAAGLTIRALEILDVTALVTLQLGQTPADTEIGILGTAEACLPATKDCSKALAYIKLNVLAQIKPSSGVFRIDGLISPDSYILHKECRPTGGFMVIAYYSGEYDGDFCVSFGGFHPAFRKPVQYPDPPPRLGISWTIGEHLSIRGQAYMAATPTAFMTGCMLSASYNQGDISAYFDACADFILNYHPVHYNVSVTVHASVSYEFTKFFIRKKISVGVDAELCLYGPPMAGYVHFNVWVFSINVPFGERYEEPKALTLKEFVDLMNEKHEKDGKDSQLSPHILSVDSGMLPTKESTKPDPEPPLWLVRRNNFVFRVCSRIAISTVLLNRPDDYDHNKPDLRGVGPIRSRPMQLDSNTQLESVLSIRLLKEGQNGVFKELDIVGETGFNPKKIESNVPISFWGEWHEGLDLLSEPRSTMRHLMGVILCPSAGSGAQSIPASTAPLTELEDAVESVSNDYVKELIDPVSVENPFGVAAIAGTDVKEKVSVRMKEIKTLAKNRAGEWSKNRAGVLKMFSDRLEKSRPKQAKALKGLSAAVPQKLFKDPQTWYPMPPRIGSQVVVSTVG